MKKKILAVLMATMMSVSIAACGSSGGSADDSNESENSTQSTNNILIADVVGMNAEEARNTLGELGFANIILSADSSSSSSMVLDSSNWIVVSQTPKAEEEVSIDTEINLSCKKIDEIEAENLQAEEQKLQSLLNLSVPDADTKLIELGYTATFFHQDSTLDITAELSAYTEEELPKWIITDIKSFDPNNKTVELFINTQENIAAQEAAAAVRESLENKLSASTAWEAAENYGSTQYPYGFELHYFMGKLAEEPKDENTWFLKATCTITNEFNAELEGTCEVTITGTNEVPEVTGFIVY